MQDVWVVRGRTVSNLNIKRWELMLFELFSLAWKFKLKLSYSISKYSCAHRRVSIEFELKAFILEGLSSNIDMFFSLKQSKRPILHSCQGLEGVLDKTICDVSRPVFRSRSDVSHIAPWHPHTRQMWSFINQELWPTAWTFDIYSLLSRQCFISLFDTHLTSLSFSRQGNI